MTFAAMDTTSNMLSQILHLLAQRPDVQNRLRGEILEARSGGKDLSYDELNGLPFLDAVCRETLRLYVPFPSSPYLPERCRAVLIYRCTSFSLGLPHLGIRLQRSFSGSTCSLCP